MAGEFGVIEKSVAEISIGPLTTAGDKTKVDLDQQYYFRSCWPGISPIQKRLLFAILLPETWFN